MKLTEFCSFLRMQGLSMRRRFLLCLFSMLFAVLTSFFLLLSILGILNPASHQIEQILEQQLDYSVSQMEGNMNRLAAYAVEFSEEISSLLQKEELSLDMLRNNSEALTALQEKTYHTVYNNMRLAKCSGAFYFLNTTVNDTLPDRYYNGIYLKYANLNSEMTIHNSVCMFRGNSSVARQNEINLHSTWNYETKAGTFPQAEALLTSANAEPAKSYLLTPVLKLPDAWEHVRFLCVPILDRDGQTLGVCGFEISDLLFSLSYQTTDNEQKYTVCSLLTQIPDAEQSGEHYYAGQLSGNESGYSPQQLGLLQFKESKPFSSISDEQISFIAKTRPITIGNSEHLVAVMLPRTVYQSYVHQEQRNTILLLLFFAVGFVGASLWLSKYYVSPILQAVEQIKKEQSQEIITHIPEIDDLFAFFAQKNQEREEELASYHEKAEHLQKEITIYSEKAKKLQQEMDLLREEHEKAKTDLTRIAGNVKKEIDPNSYEQFTAQLKTLTPKEQEVFNLYVDGKSTKEIMELMGISNNGLKYHNKNIYSKLGVPSRKELLRYAAILKQHNELQ